jgi:thiamine biosynthesis lipoprotein
MPARHVSFDAIGTKWTIEVRSPMAADAWEGLLVRVYGRIRAFDTNYSRFRADSLVSRLGLRPGSVDLPTDGHALLEFYEKLYRATDGKVTPLIGQAMVDTGYDAEYSLTPKAMRTVPAWDDIISYDKTSLTVAQPALLDFGAAGKGYLVDIIASLFAKADIQDFTIDASGDIMHRSPAAAPARIGMENPQDPTEAIGIVELGNQSLCASSGSKRQWGSFTHIIDPDELKSPRDILATWVVADDTMTADGLATALSFTAPEILRKLFSFEWAILKQDMSLETSKDFPAELFKAAA